MKRWRKKRGASETKGSEMAAQGPLRGMQHSVCPPSRDNSHWLTSCRVGVEGQEATPMNVPHLETDALPQLLLPLAFVTFGTCRGGQGLVVVPDERGNGRRQRAVSGVSHTAVPPHACISKLPVAKLRQLCLGSMGASLKVCCTLYSWVVFINPP